MIPSSCRLGELWQTQDFLRQLGTRIYFEKVLKFIGSKSPEFFENYPESDNE